MGIGTRIFFMLVVIGAIGTVIWFWQASPLQPESAASLRVAATIFPLADITKAIGGGHVAVQLLIPPGVTEHVDALRPDQLADITRAQTIFQIGHGLDDRLVANVLKVNPSMRAITVGQGIDIRTFSADEEEHHDADEAEEEQHAEAGSDDPHYWLTVPNASKIAATIAAALVEADPTHAADYQQNLEAYQAELAVLEKELQATAAAAPQKHFIAMHNAWSYLADAYGFELVDTYEPIEGQQPSIQDLQHLQAVAKQYGITTFYAEPQKASSSATRFIEQEIGLTIHSLDPVGGLPPYTSYVALMRGNINALAQREGTN